MVGPGFPTINSQGGARVAWLLQGENQYLEPSRAGTAIRVRPPALVFLFLSSFIHLCRRPFPNILADLNSSDVQLVILFELEKEIFTTRELSTLAGHLSGSTVQLGRSHVNSDMLFAHVLVTDDEPKNRVGSGWLAWCLPQPKPGWTTAATEAMKPNY